MSDLMPRGKPRNEYVLIDSPEYMYPPYTFYTPEGRLTPLGLNAVLWTSLRLSQARQGDKWWVWSAIPNTEVMNRIRWETRER